jgi:hypothetical protein
MSFKIFFGDNIREKISPDKVLIASPYPNPFLNAEEVNLQLALPESMNRYRFEIERLDEVGRVISRQSVLLNSGLHKIKIKGSDEEWIYGINFYRIRVSNGVLNESFHGKLIIR